MPQGSPRPLGASALSLLLVVHGGWWRLAGAGVTLSHHYTEFMRQLLQPLRLLVSQFLQKALIFVGERISRQQVRATISRSAQ